MLLLHYTTKSRKIKTFLNIYATSQLCTKSRGKVQSFRSTRSKKVGFFGAQRDFPALSTVEILLDEKLIIHYFRLFMHINEYFTGISCILFRFLLYYRKEQFEKE